VIVSIVLRRKERRYVKLHANHCIGNVRRIRVPTATVKRQNLRPSLFNKCVNGKDKRARFPLRVKHILLLFVAERGCGIHPGGTPGGKQASEQRDGHQHSAGADVARYIRWAHLEKQAAD
jgi:hypothetical protein